MAEERSEMLVVLDKIAKDVKKASANLTEREARYLVGTYYNMQGYRIRAESQIRAIEQALNKEPHGTLDWFLKQAETLEDSLRAALGEFAKNRIVGKWSQSIMGIGPVLSAGLIAYIQMNVWKCIAPDMEKLKRKPKDRCWEGKPCSKACDYERTNVAGRIWRYAGLDPTLKWEKGKKRPWNGPLKVLCWKIGQSFVKVSTNPKDFYGAYYRQRKEKEILRNDRGEFHDQANLIITEKNIGKETEAYQWYAGCYPDGTMNELQTFATMEQRSRFLKGKWEEPGTYSGKLPPAHIQARAERYAVKLFISHWHHVAYRAEFGELPPNPYVMDILGHPDMIQVPNYPWPNFRWRNTEAREEELVEA